MAWTTTDRVNEWVKGVDLVAEPAALNQSLADGQGDLYDRLIQFIAKATVDTWTDTTDTPERVQYWTARISAAIYMSKYQGYHLQPEIPDNPAANVYDSVLEEIEEAAFGRVVIVDQAGDVVPVAAITVTAATDYIAYLPVSQGGEIPD